MQKPLEHRLLGLLLFVKKYSYGKLINEQLGHALYSSSLMTRISNTSPQFEQ